MFTHHRRIPSLLILIAAFAAGALYLRVWGKAGPSESLEQLEKRIAGGKADVNTWRDYGDRLVESRKFARAADAYRKALELAPSQRELRIKLAVALAGGGQEEELYNYMRELITRNDSKLVLELFDKPELAKYLAQDQFLSLQTDARNQSVD